MEENNQIINQVKSVLTSPNWKNEGKNETLNKEYKALMDKYFGSYIKDLNNPKYTDAAILKFATKDEGYRAAFNIFKGGKAEYAQSGKKNIGLNLIKNNENVILEIHGSKEGEVAYGGYTFKTNEIIQRLEDTGLIPKGTKQIYTMSCYGGLQEKGLTSSGIPFESSHTSLEPTIGYANRDIDDSIDNTLKESYQQDVDNNKSQIEEYTKYLEEEKEDLNKIKNEHPDWTDIIQDKEKNIKEYQKEIDYYKKQLADSEKKLQEHIEQIAKSDNKKSTLVNLTKSGNTTDKYKQNVLDSFKKYGDDFAKAEFITEPKEIENALWYLISPEKHKNILDSLEAYEGLVKIYKETTQAAKELIPFYKRSLQEAKESNDTEKIKEYTEKLKENKKDIEENKKYIEKYSTIVDKRKLQLQEIDKKDKLYGKDYKAKSNFPPLNLKEKFPDINLTEEELQKAAHDYFFSKSSDIWKSRFNKKYNNEVKNYIINNFFNEDISVSSKGSFEKALDEAFLKSPGYHLDAEMYQNGKQYIYDELSNFARSDEAKDMILDYIYKGDQLDAESFLKANAKGWEGEKISHGLFAFDNHLTLNNFDGNQRKQIKNNLHTILNEKDIEIAASSADYAIGEIGVFGKAKNAKYALSSDMMSRIADDGTRKHAISDEAINNILSDYLSEYEENNISGKWKPNSRHDEVITSIDEIDSLWVKKDYFDKNKDFVASLMKESGIENLDIIHASEAYEDIYDAKIERITYNDLAKSISEDSNKYLSSKEAFEKYGLDSDEFYTSQGLDPKEQRKITNKLNSKRNPTLSDKEILNKLHYDTEEAANQFRKTTKEANQIIGEYNKLKTLENANFTKEYSDLLKDILQPDPYLKTVEERTGYVEYYDLKTQREHAFRNTKQRASDKNPKIGNIDVNKEAEPISIRYHQNKEHVFSIDNTKLGDNIKINSFGDNFGHTGTWSSPRVIPGFETAWLMNNREWIKTDSKGKPEGYISVFKFKDDAKILKISNEDDLIGLIKNFGTDESKKDILSSLVNIDEDTKSSLKRKHAFEPNIKKDELASDISKKIKINWDKVSKEYDAVRIRTPGFISSPDIPYSWIMSEYYGDTDVIFNKKSVDVLKTMSIDQYYKDLDKEFETGDFTNYEIKPKPQKPKPQKPKPEIKKTEPKIPEKPKPEIKKPTPEIKKPIPEKPIQNTVKQNNKLTSKTIQNTAKKALNTKTLGIAAIGATVAVAGAIGISAHNKNKRKRKKENEYTYPEDNSYINYNQDLQYADNIVGFSTGHSTYSLT